MLLVGHLLVGIVKFDFNKDIIFIESYRGAVIKREKADPVNPALKIWSCLLKNADTQQKNKRISLQSSSAA